MKMTGISCEASIFFFPSKFNALPIFVEVHSIPNWTITMTGHSILKVKSHVLDMVKCHGALEIWLGEVRKNIISLAQARLVSGCLLWLMNWTFNYFLRRELNWPCWDV